MSSAQHSDKGTWVRKLIEEFIKSTENTLGNNANDEAFGAPIVGYARGDDPIFEEFKTDIGAFYLTPSEVFEKAYPGSGARPDELTVISWILPHIKKTKMDNRRENAYPSERWARGKKFGQQVIIKLQNRLVEKLKEAGYRAMVPFSPSHWSEEMSEKYGYASTWSERHTAFAAGLGTFGLCEGLITPVGKAMRCGSVVAEIAIPPTERSYKNHNEYCLFLTEGTCGLCMTRCPAGAITEKGHDKKKCRAYVDGICTEYAKHHFELDVNVCGLCQTKVPCESGIPKRKKPETTERHPKNITPAKR